MNFNFPIFDPTELKSGTEFTFWDLNRKRELNFNLDDHLMLMIDASEIKSQNLAKNFGEIASSW